MFRYLVVTDHSQEMENWDALDYLKRITIPHGDLLGSFGTQDPPACSSQQGPDPELIGDLEMPRVVRSIHQENFPEIIAVMSIIPNDASQGIIFKIDPEYRLNALFTLYHHIQTLDEHEIYDRKILSIRLRGTDDTRPMCTVRISGYSRDAEDGNERNESQTKHERYIDYFIFSTGYDHRFLTVNCDAEILSGRRSCIDRIRNLGFDYLAVVHHSEYFPDSEGFDGHDGLSQICTRLPIRGGLIFGVNTMVNGIDYIEALKIPSLIDIEYCGCMQSYPRVKCMTPPGSEVKLMIYEVDAESG